MFKYLDENKGEVDAKDDEEGIDEKMLEDEDSCEKLDDFEEKGTVGCMGGMFGKKGRYLHAAALPSVVMMVKIFNPLSLLLRESPPSTFCLCSRIIVLINIAQW